MYEQQDPIHPESNCARVSHPGGMHGIPMGHHSGDSYLQVLDRTGRLRVTFAEQ